MTIVRATVFPSRACIFYCDKMLLSYIFASLKRMLKSSKYLGIPLLWRDLFLRLLKINSLVTRQYLFRKSLNSVISKDLATNGCTSMIPFLKKSANGSLFWLAGNTNISFLSVDSAYIICFSYIKWIKEQGLVLTKAFIKPNSSSM